MESVSFGMRKYQICLCIFGILSGIAALDLTDEGGLYIRLVGISFANCKNECEMRQKCLFLKYRRLNTLCELLDTVHLANTDPGFYNYSKVLFLHQTDQYRAICDGCTTEQDCYINTTLQSAVCITETCNVPAYENGLTKYGNMRTVFSSVNYICDAPPHETYSTTCQVNGQWSSALFKNSCLCRLPDIENSENVTWEYVNSTFVTGQHVCLPGYEARYTRTPICNFVTRERTGYAVTNACCGVNTRDGWIKVLRYPAYIAGGNIYQVWSHPGRLVNGVADYCRYGNNDILDDWESFNIQRIKVDIIKYDTIVAYIIFDGTGSSYIDWFTGSRLLESSWSDLTSQSAPHVNIFSINGTSDITGPNSFVIANNVNNDCSSDVGWLLMAKSSTPYDCSTEFPGTETRIVYAISHKAEIFSGTDSNVDYADRVEIWVEF